ncbi:hypothetical protein amb2441 [Paramagnetospirillum magneticum AMB-1]|uniref:Uncharacterized protein n=1 Tax=Paramagnetospirillum magneticum (strain ATCC 700264 / AMB-1) TaxID=342108 RepID=Q2W4I0_PARM1|nr:hypothetical protein amb2398 [Paramagnetospirillum magneticum AMB-1]BAE51245.1 hypothetical protein amb2441 [Paramagnetospirillum magneticum AMB-1]
MATEQSASHMAYCIATGDFGAISCDPEAACVVMRADGGYSVATEADTKRLMPFRPGARVVATFRPKDARS